MTLTPLTRQRLRVLLNEWNRAAITLERLFEHIEDLVEEGVIPQQPPPADQLAAPSP